MTEQLLVINAGSSSIKFAIYPAEAGSDQALFRGEAEGLGPDDQGGHLRIQNSGRECVLARDLDGSHESALKAMLEWLDAEVGPLAAVGHRVVHGGLRYGEPVRLNPDIMRDLEALGSLAVLHQPHNLSSVRILERQRLGLPQVACFDTAFHRTQPWEAQRFALPRKLTESGIVRYGFHGLSYEFISEYLQRHHPRLHGGRVLVAHLGNGASLCAMHNGRSMATSMGFTALDGLPMGQRCGSLDPGVVLYLINERGMSAREVEDMLYRQSGLLGMSGISHDMRALLASDDPAAAEAGLVYGDRAAREIGSLAAALQGLDGLVFTGGVGQHAAPVREGICQRLGWLGVYLDAERNAGHAGCISRDDSLPVLVIPTDEERIIARHTRRLVLGVD